MPAVVRSPQTQHLEELDDHEGEVIHWSEDRGPGWWVGHAVMTYADGSPDPDEAPAVHVETSDSLSPQDAALLGQALLRAAREAQT